MYKVISLKELDTIKDLGLYKLSYVDSIPESCTDYDEQTKEYMKTLEYQAYREKHGWSANNPRIRTIEKPHPDWILGKQEFYAYFCPVTDMGEVWGDDHDDAPYSCNAGCPYDTNFETREEMIILQVPFALPPVQIYRGVDWKLPDGWSILNEPWSAEDINLGALPWIWFRTCKWKGGNRGISVMAGTSLIDFKEKLKEIWRIAEESGPELKEYSIVGVYGEPTSGEIYYAIEHKESHLLELYDKKTLVPLRLEGYEDILDQRAIPREVFDPGKHSLGKLREMPDEWAESEFIRKVKRTWERM